MLGMILVVHTSIGGDKLIFRYPTVTRNKVSDETLMAFKQQHPLTTMNPNQPGLNKSSNETENNQQDQTVTNNINLKDKHFIYNLSSVVITPILTPKLRLCDQSFELTIENTTFVGYPTCLTNPNDDIFSSSSNNSSSNIRKHNDNDGNNVNSKNKYQQNQPNQQNIGCEDRPKGSQISDSNGTDSNTSNKDKESKNHQYDEITLFNLVFVISANNRELSQKKVLDSFKRVSMQLSAALKHEQIRCNYITNQVHEMLVIREKWLTEQTLETTNDNSSSSSNSTSGNSNSNINSSSGVGNSSANSPTSNNANSNCNKSSHQDLTDRILEKSSLAREIRDIFTGLLEKGVISIKINNWIHIHASLNNPDHYPLYPVRTYHALLPFTGDDSLQLPVYDPSPALSKLLDVARPIKSFRDLQIETDIPLAQIYRLASHLVYWRKAKIINMMTKNNFYILNPNSSQPSLDYILLNKKFSTQFPDFKLPDILQRFSQARPLGDHISKFLPPFQTQFLIIVGWLLQYDLIVQLYTFIHLIIPLNTSSQVHHKSSSKHSFLNSSTSSSNNNSSSFFSDNNQPLLYPPPQYPLLPSTFAQHEKTFFENIDDNTKSYQLFKRLSPYFRGLHHIEEIMWRENISRDELNKTLRKYKNVLVQVIHEAPEINNPN